MLTPTDEDVQKIADAALDQKVLQKPCKLSDLIDREFIPKDIHLPTSKSHSSSSAP